MPPMALAVIAVLLPAIVHASELSSARRSQIVASGRVGDEVVAALDSTGRARVMVAFALPAAQRAASLDAGSRRRAVETTRAAVLSAVGAQDFDLRHAFENVNAVAGEITAEGVLALLERPELLRIDVDAPGSAMLNQALPLMTISNVKTLGLTGAGVVTAVIDSGVDTDHPDLSDSVIDQACFCSGGGGCCPGGGATQTGLGAAEDDNGHGTNVAGIITGNGTVAPQGGAPDADLIAVKVLDAGNGFCCSSDVVAGLDWVIDNHPEAAVVNMSLGTAALFPGACDTATAFTMAYATAIDTLRANGTITFVATGNARSPTHTSAPACVANAVAVGAVWDGNLGSQTVLGCTDGTTAADQPTCFSNSNANTDLFAAGAPISATGLGGGGSTYFGTSQAAPAAAACAADLIESAPALSPSQIEAALESSPVIVTDAKNGLSFPRVDCLAALDALSNPTTSTTSTTTSTSTTSTLPELCAAAPLAGCRPTVESGKAKLSLKDKTPDTGDAVKWKWTKGAATLVDDWGDPLSATHHVLCLYDASASLVMSVRAPGGGTCAAKPCWKAKVPTGFLYADRELTPDGVAKLSVKAGTAGKTQIGLTAKGANVPLPSLGGLALPLRAQWQANGLCWEATFSADRSPDPSHFNGTSD